jgi:phage terminase Nu1 subunit (DNA packaging protein)
MSTQVSTIATKNDATLDSWKEIASFLRRGVRTVQRWERTEGLPVRRHHHGQGASVSALASELQTWMRARQQRWTGDGPGRDGAGETNQFDRLHRLVLRQHVLTTELRQLLAVAAREGSRSRQRCA